MMAESLTEQELNLLTEVLGERLEKNWALCDKYVSTDFEKYEIISDECRLIRNISRVLYLGFPDHIASRF